MEIQEKGLLKVKMLSKKHMNQIRTWSDWRNLPSDMKIIGWYAWDNGIDCFLFKSGGQFYHCVAVKKLSEYGEQIFID